MDVVLCGCGAGMALRGPGGHGVVRAWLCARVERTWRRARRAGMVVRRTVRAGLARAGLGIILVCKFD